MQGKTLIAALVAAAFAFPLAANANDKAKTAAANDGNDGGAAAMFKAMDKNGDGFISKDEAKGTPHAADFATLDKNGDGKLSHKELAYTKGLGSSKEPSTSISSDQPATQPGGRAEGLTTSTPTEARISKGN